MDEGSRDELRSLGGYSILGRLGEGGMGEVLLARDAKLDRKVALKVLSDELRAEPDRRTRFLREAKAHAHLSHPNVTQIFEIGEADGRDFIAFEYVDGDTLHDLLAAGKLPLARIVDLALPLVDAIGYAHERGIVHRDIKAANVMVTKRGHPKLLDFGLAKVLHEGSQAPEAKKSTTLTMRGAIFGTPSAMSPEQALGRPVDVRSDVFSFGSLLYEMASGRPAFGGETVMEVMDAVIHEEPEPLERLRPELTGELCAIVEKALRKDPAERYQTMSDLAADLRHFKRQTDSGLVPPATRRSRRSRLPLVLGGIGATAAAAVALALFPRGGDEPAGPPAAGEAGRFVAVMFFENVTNPEDPERLGVMLAHLLTTELSAGEGLDVLSQQRLFELARRAGRSDGTIDRAVASEVARLAGVETMILGEVLDAGGRVVSTASLVEVSTGAEIGSFKAEGEGSGDVFAMAESLGADVRDLLTPDVVVAGGGLQQKLTQSVDAYRAYVRGREILTEGPFWDAIDAFTEAVGIDPGFALAHYWRGIAENYMSMNEAAARSFEKAAAFRDVLPEDVRSTLDVARLYATHEDEEALRLVPRVLEEDPDSLFTHYMAGEIYIHSPTLVDSEKAAAHFRRAVEIDPGFSMVYDHVLMAHMFAGRVEEAWGFLEEWELDEAQRKRLENIVLGLEGRAEELHEAGEDGLEAGAVALERWDVVREWVAGIDLDEVRATPPSRLPARLRGNAAEFVSVGRFETALELLEEVPTSLEGSVEHAWLGSVTVAAHLDRADLYVLRGDADAALASARAAVDLQPDCPRPLYHACVQAAILGDADSAREYATRLEQAAALERSPTTPRYRDAAAAELALLAGDAEEARRSYAEIVAGTRFIDDWFVANTTLGPLFRSRLAEASLAAGDAGGARRALEDAVDLLQERSLPLWWIPALHRLGMLELEAGMEDEARGHLERFLAAWGEADWDLPQVAEARAALEGLH